MESFYTGDFYLPNERNSAFGRGLYAAAGMHVPKEFATDSSKGHIQKLTLAKNARVMTVKFTDIQSDDKYYKSPNLFKTTVLTNTAAAQGYSAIRITGPYFKNQLTDDYVVVLNRGAVITSRTNHL
jgi:hypothetical protein